MFSKGTLWKSQLLMTMNPEGSEGRAVCEEQWQMHEYYVKGLLQSIFLPSSFW